MPTIKKAGEKCDEGRVSCFHTHERTETDRQAVSQSVRQTDRKTDRQTEERLGERCLREAHRDAWTHLVGCIIARRHLPARACDDDERTVLCCCLVCVTVE